MIDDFVHLRRWYDHMKTRPGLRRGFDVGKDMRKRLGSMDEDARKVLFGQRAQKGASEGESR